MARSYSFDQLRKVRIAIVVHEEEPVHLASGVSPNDPRRIVAEKAEKWPNGLTGFQNRTFSGLRSDSGFQQVITAVVDWDIA